MLHLYGAETGTLQKIDQEHYESFEMLQLYGAETGTLQKIDQEHYESFEMWC
jgi:hypothetical protein